MSFIASTFSFGAVELETMDFARFDYWFNRAIDAAKALERAQQEDS